MTDDQNLTWGPKATDITMLLNAFSESGTSENRILLIVNVVVWMMDRIYRDQVKALADRVETHLEEAEKNIREARTDAQFLRTLMDIVEQNMPSVSSEDDFLMWKLDRKGNPIQVKMND